MAYNIKLTGEGNKLFEKVTGIEKTVRLARKFFLTTIGTDPKYKNVGSYLKDMVGTSVSDLGDIGMQLVDEVERVENQIKTIQMESDYYVPPEEQLVSIELIEIIQDPNSDYWGINGRFKLTTREGEEFEGKLFSKQA